jgi:iron complex outermembrane receptor protein
MKAIHWAAYGAAASILAIATSVSAQEAPDPKGATASEPATASQPGAMDDIVVTARRREERLQDVPVAVTAISAKGLEQRAIISTEDLRYAVPSLQVSPSTFGAAVPGYTIRGQRQLESLLTQDPSVGIYFADVVQQRPHGTNAAIYDLASVQVLKGPQGTLFGRNTTGGAVLFNPAKPTDQFGGSLSVTGGNYDLRRGTAIINIPLTDDFMIRAAGQITRRDGYNRNLTTGLRTDGERTESARFSVRWLASDTVTNDLVLNYFHENDSGSGLIVTGVRPLDDPLQPNSPAARTPGALAGFARQRARSVHVIENNFQPSAFTRAWGLSNTTAIEATDLITVKNIFGYRHVKAINSLDFDGLPVVLFETTNYLKTDQWSNEFQVIGHTADNRLNYIGGVYVFEESGDDIQSSYLGGPRVNNGYGKNTSWSGFLQGGYKLTEQLTLTAGARYTIDDRKLIARSTIGSPPVCRITDAQGNRLNPCARPASTAFSSPTWLVSLDYKPDTNTLLYVAHRRGYRSGGFNLRSLTPSTFTPFKPETVYDVEGGVKVDLFDRRLRINGAIYNQWYKDIQRTVSFVPPGATLVSTSVINAADAKIKGGELEVTARPIDLIELNGNVSYTDAKYSSFRDACCDLSRNKFTQVPKLQASGYARVNLPLPPEQGEAGIQLGIYHQSSMEVSDLNTPISIRPYTLLDLNANWNRFLGSAFDVSVFVKNLTDKEYTTSGIAQYGSDAQHLSLGVQAETIGAPRTVGVELRYHFGEGI